MQLPPAMRRTLAVAPVVLARTALASSSIASVVSAGITAPIARRLHTSTIAAHNHPSWPLRSHAFFRERDAAERAEEEATAATHVDQPAFSIAHPHPTQVEALPAGMPTHFAVFRFRNEQFKAVEDDVLMMNLVDAEVGDTIVVDDVMLLAGRDRTLVGRPSIAGARVTLQVEEHTHTTKVVVFKKKRRKTYKRKAGHRDEVTHVRVLKIELPEGTQPLTLAKATPLPAEPVVAPEGYTVVPTFTGDRRRAPLNPAGVRSFSTLATARRWTPSVASSTPAAAAASLHTSAAPANATAAASAPTNESTIDTLLRRELQASALQIEDTSGGCGAFFRLLVVSPKFTGLSLVKQHRLVNETLKPHIANLHGLTLTTFTEEQWKQLQQQRQ